jgi:hypothetical protein
MQQAEHKPGLIHDRRDAVIALCLTGFVTAWSVRDAVYQSQHKLPWLLDLQFMLPSRAAVAVNVGFYTYLLCLGVVFYRMARGKERVLVAGWFAGIVFVPVRILVSTSGAAVDYVEAVGMMAAFLAAVHILIDVFASADPRVDNQAPRNT